MSCSSYIKMIYNVKISQICITLVYSRDTISKKMLNLNVKLIIEAGFEFCYIIGLKDLLINQLDFLQVQKLTSLRTLMILI